MISGIYISLGLISSLFLLLIFSIAPVDMASLLLFLFPVSFFIGAYGASKGRKEKSYLLIFAPLLAALIAGGMYALHFFGLI